jgi:hypothetical protein
MADNELQRLEARLAALERQLSQSSGAQPSGAQPSSVDDENNPMALLAGAIANALPSVGRPAQGGQGPAAQADTGDSFLWCCSRFICVTPRCGTGSWC